MPLTVEQRAEIDFQGILRKVSNRFDDIQKETDKEGDISLKNRRFLHEDQIRVLDTFFHPEIEAPTDLKEKAVQYLYDGANFELRYC